MRWTYVTSTEESPSQGQAATVGSWGSIRDGREGVHPYPLLTHVSTADAIV